MTGRPRMAMSSDFLDACARLPRARQRGVRSLISKFSSDPTASGPSYERVRAARDPAMRSLRIGQGYRALALKSGRGDAVGRESAETGERALAHVAATRAKREAPALGFGAPSRLLSSGSAARAAA